MSNKQSINNCDTCDHSKYLSEGHCYMFRNEPEFECMAHTEKKVRVGTIAHINNSHISTMTSVLPLLEILLAKERIIKTHKEIEETQTLQSLTQRELKDRRFKAKEEKKRFFKQTKLNK